LSGIGLFSRIGRYMAKISKINGKLIDQDQKAYMGLCQMLFNNELVPGQKIAYKNLALRLGVSTTPVIHALKRLENKGIVRREPNKGYLINSINLEEVEEIFDSRLAIEVSVLPKTALRYDEAGFARLTKALEAHDLAVEENNFNNRVMTDLRFHMALASLSGTHIQVVLLEDLFDRLLLKYSKELFIVSMTSTSQSEHYAIIEAVKKRDVAQMTVALTEHLTVTKNHILQGLSQLLENNSMPAAKYHSFEDIKEGV
jgi:DNA-binding GntR family transcriptional regulator